MQAKRTDFFTVNMEAATPTIVLSGYIGWGDECDYKGFRAAFDQVKAAGHTFCKLVINSFGGDMMEGFAIYDYVLTCGLEVEVEVAGVAASMATVLMALGKTRKANNHSRIMIHRPQCGAYGETQQLQSRIELMDKLEKDSTALYMKITGKDEATVKSWMQPGVEKWFTAPEAKAAGLITDIIDAPAPAEQLPEPTPGNSASVQQMVRVFNSFIQTSKPQTTNMEVNLTSEQAKKFGLPSNSTTAASLVEMLEKKSDELASMQAAQTAAAKARATAIVNKGIAEKKLTEADRAEFEKVAETSPEAVENMLTKMSAPKLPGNSITEGDGTNPEDRKNWTADDWRQKDSAGLAAMQASDPDKFKKIMGED